MFMVGEVSDGTINRLLAAGVARRLARGIYTTDVLGSAEDVVAKRWRTIVARAVPDAVVADRSAVPAQPVDGWLFVDGGLTARVRPLVLPGLTVVARRGPGPLPDDLPIEPGLWLSSVPRALLDNTRRSRSHGGRPASTLSDDELADWLDHQASNFGPERLRQLREAASDLAPLLGPAIRPDRVDELIGAALGTRQVESGSGRMRARQAGRPFDPRRVEMFDRLATHLESVAPTPMAEGPDERRAHEAFFESYFSNFIEGTVLSLEDAEAVMYQRASLPTQPEDGHDVAATFDMASDPIERAVVPRHADDLREILQRRHERLMAARPDKHPGTFKEVVNRVGVHVFVAPPEVLGTLDQGWARIDALSDPFARAVLMMFVVAEVHPFDDGNGRLARLMMNAELSAAGQSRIIVPTVYRGEYLSALSALSANGRPDAIERVLAFAQRWTSQVDFSDLALARRQVDATNAFVDPGIALQEGIKLALLSSVPAWRLDR